MIFFEYHSDEKTGILKPGMTKKETRMIMKSNYDHYEKKEFRKENDYFITIGIIAYYSDKGILSEIKLADKSSIFMYKNMNLFSNYSKVKSKK